MQEKALNKLLDTLTLITVPNIFEITAFKINNVHIKLGRAFQRNFKLLLKTLKYFFAVKFEFYRKSLMITYFLLDVAFARLVHRAGQGDT